MHTISLLAFSHYPHYLPANLSPELSLWVRVNNKMRLMWEICSGHYQTCWIDNFNLSGKSNWSQAEKSEPATRIFCHIFLTVMLLYFCHCYFMYIVVFVAHGIGKSNIILGFVFKGEFSVAVKKQTRYRNCTSVSKKDISNITCWHFKLQCRFSSQHKEALWRLYDVQYDVTASIICSEVTVGHVLTARVFVQALQCIVPGYNLSHESLKWCMKNSQKQFQNIEATFGLKLFWKISVSSIKNLYCILPFVL